MVGLRYRIQLPDFCALVPIAWCVSYAITMLVLGPRAGLAGPGYAIQIGLVLVAAPLFGAIGILVGRLAQRVPAVRTRAAGMTKWWWPAVLIVAALASCLAIVVVHTARREALPRVSVQSASFHRLDVVPPTEGITRASRIFDYLARINRPMAWSDGSFRVEGKDDTLVLTFGDTSEVLRIPLRGIRHVAAVDAAAFKTGAGFLPALALLITGSATGRRDLLAIVSASRKLVYLELLERTWSLGPVPLAILQSPARDVVLVGSEPQGMVAYGS